MNPLALLLAIVGTLAVLDGLLRRSKNFQHVALGIVALGLAGAIELVAN